MSEKCDEQIAIHWFKYSYYYYYYTVLSCSKMEQFLFITLKELEASWDYSSHHSTNNNQNCILIYVHLLYYYSPT